VGQFVVVVKAVVIVAEAQRTVPGHAGVLPLVPPLHFGSGAHEELHLHLLELAHTEDELTGHDLVAEGLARSAQCRTGFSCVPVLGTFR